MKEYFSKLWDYNLWANTRVLEAVAANPGHPKLIELFSHILSAQVIWLNRIQGVPDQSPGVWDVYRSDELAPKMLASNKAWSQFLATYKSDTLYEEIHYTNSKGNSFQDSLVDILAHVINHSTHHRAQIVIKLRELALTPPVTDYIFYLRDKSFRGT